MSSTTITSPNEMAISGTHDTIIDFLIQRFPETKGIRVLDLGAGQGSLSLKLRDAGYEVSACDLDADNFKLTDIECLEVDANGALPYSNNTFDIVLSIEVVEHIENHGSLFNEVCRVLKPKAHYFFSTPNILSLKYRLGFLFSGYGYSFGPLTPGERAPATQHISPFSIDRYTWLLSLSGLNVSEVATDKLQSTSKLFYWLMPLIRLIAWKNFGRSTSIKRQNSRVALLGRTLMVVAQKQ